MNIEKPTVKIAYEFIKQHDQFLADRLLKDFRQTVDDMKLAVDRQREREAKYDASMWQRLTQRKMGVLRPFDRMIKDLQIIYRSCENDIINEAEAISDEIVSHREYEIEAGNFVYYIVDLDTNVRKSENGVPVIYSTVEAAEWDFAEEFDTVVSIAEYNRIYGSFMED